MSSINLLHNFPDGFFIESDSKFACSVCGGFPKEPHETINGDLFCQFCIARSCSYEGNGEGSSYGKTFKVSNFAKKQIGKFIVSCSCTKQNGIECVLTETLTEQQSRLCPPSKNVVICEQNNETQMRDSSRYLCCKLINDRDVFDSKSKSVRTSTEFEWKKRKLVNEDDLCSSSKNVRKDQHESPPANEIAAVYIDSDDDVSIDNNDYVVIDSDDDVSIDNNDYV
jgi:hypothetical protein